MTGRAAVIVIALALCPARVHAQDTVFTVSVSSADVHKGPSVVTPVIGHVSHGTVMPVSRNLGSWVKVEWPEAPDGFAYVHVTSGQLGARNGNASISNATSRTSPPVAGSASSSASMGSSGSASAASPYASATVQTARPPKRSHERVVVRSQQDGTLISHVVGVGGMFGSMSSFGATARTWRDNRLGFQVGFTRDSMTSASSPGQVTSMQVEPAVVYGMFDRVSDYFWIRPYVGSGLSIRHQSLQNATPSGPATASTGMGFRAFGGAEVTFAGAPRFGLSVDGGYRRFSTPFPGFEPAHFTVFVSGNWYVK